MSNVVDETTTNSNSLSWFKYGFVREKEDRTVVKMYTPDGSFLKSIIMPTKYYPLEGIGKHQIFTCYNTEMVSDEKVLSLIDGVKYEIGHCYENTEKIVDVLQKHGYDAKSYVGWLFVSPTRLPVHHCWCVLNNNMVIDLADEITFFEEMNREGKYVSHDASDDEARKGYVAYTRDVHTLPNSKRCYPVGKPSGTFYYVGRECSPDTGRAIYQHLLNEFPDHETQRDVDCMGRNKTQQLLNAVGLMS